MNPFVYDAFAIPLSLIVLAGVLFFFHRVHPEQTPDTPPADPTTGDHHSIHWRAWVPFIVILLAIPISLFILNISHTAMISFIMLAGAVTAIILAPQEFRSKGLSQGAKHAGLIIFDICGAGALGFVIVSTGFAQGTLGQLTQVIPIILVPFILAALIETAQGSRVVTAVITAQVIAGSAVVYALHPITLILLISAGSCMVSYVTDPFFWLVQRTTGDDIKTVVRNYTLPIALAGIGIFIVALALEYFVFR
jgi:GntP family gluconate:H+ symporter